MGWKHAKKTLDFSRSLSIEKRKVREIGELLKLEMNQLSMRMTQMNKHFGEIRARWSTIKAPTEGSRSEFESLKIDIHNLSRDFLRLMTDGDDEFYETVKAIGETPKRNLDQLVTLTTRLHDICKGKLENNVPRCKEVADSREQLIQRLAELADNENCKPAP